MLKKVRQKIVRLVLASMVILVLAGTPTIPTVHAGDCPTSNGGSSC